MKHYSPSDFSWKDNQLYLGNKKTGYSVVWSKESLRDAKTELYHVRWPDGVLSEDFYNITHAKNNAVTMALEDMKKTPGEKASGEVTGALK